MEDARPDGPWLLSRERLTPLERTLFGAFSLVPLLAVRDLVIRPWPAILSWAGLLIAPIVLGALSVSALFAAAAVFAPERDIHVDPVARAVIDSGRARWHGQWGRRFPFDDIQEVAIHKDYETDGPDRLKLVLVVKGRRLPVPLLYRPLDRRAELDDLAARLRAVLQL
ncbi:MAG TPA: hypothetical protein VM899_06350 [Rubellimicrobium sp.]|jgi:hypothetical protein|nr:hypothetical protein [Rubellimicrobium sp.]